MEYSAEEIERRARVIHALALRVSRGDWDFAQDQALAVVRNPSRCIARGTVQMEMWRHRRKQRSPSAVAIPNDKSSLHPKYALDEERAAGTLWRIVRRARLNHRERLALRDILAERTKSGDARAYQLRKKLCAVYRGLPVGRWQQDKMRRKVAPAEGD